MSDIRNTDFTLIKASPSLHVALMKPGTQFYISTVISVDHVTVEVKKRGTFDGPNKPPLGFCTLC